MKMIQFQFCAYQQSNFHSFTKTLYLLLRKDVENGNPVFLEFFRTVSMGFYRLCFVQQ